MNHLALLAAMSLATQASAACTRAALQEATTAYVAALAAGKPSWPALSSNASYAENDVPMDITKGVLSAPIAIDFNRSIYDTTGCATFTEISAPSAKHPYVINTRLLFTDDKVTGVESVVTDAGDWAFDAAGHLRWAKQERWDVIPEASRDARAVIQAAADAYLDQWANTSIAVPLGTPCARLEGGSYTGSTDPTANTCRMPAFPQPLKVAKRRYVVDEELGAVDVFNGFPWLEASKPADYGTPSSNFIRVEVGKIRYIHEVTACATKQCGR
ncbi:hypothetical protein F5Y15DRAFT_131668 [Xylariaceae sp. FL0016]|nr:hypothetical protein F5Y15DRAFT_131668 [Xylariaceae sp. FL0016]